MKKRMMACLLSILLAFSWGALAEAPAATDAPAPAENAIFVEAGYRHSFALDANGALWGWGAGEYGRIKKGVFVGMVYTAAGVLIAALFNVVLCRPLMQLFLNTDLSAGIAAHYEEVLGYGAQYLLWQWSFYLFLGAIYVYRNTLQGIGKSAVTTFAGVTELAGRIVASLVFVRLWGFSGICTSNAAAWVAAVAFLVATYLVCMRRLGKQQALPPRRTRAHLRRLRRSCSLAVRRAS